MQIYEIATYGRWFPYDGQAVPYWWYDLYSEQAIDIEDLCRFMGYVDSKCVDLNECMSAGKIPFFRVDIPKLKLRYAGEFMRDRLKELQSMDMKAMDYAFNKYIEAYDLVSHWYRYEMDVLSQAAREWCKENGIAYQFN